MPIVCFCRLTDEEVSLNPSEISDYRKEKLRAQKNAQICRQSLYSEALLRYTLRECGFAVPGALDIAVTEHGKPFLRDVPLFFSLSHSSEGILCAASKREIGADIQIRTPVRPALTRRFFTSDEQSFIQNAQDLDAAFTEIWVGKESYCKLDGRGLALPLSTFSVLDEKIAPLLWHTTIGEYHLAVCGREVSSDPIELNVVDARALFH